MQRFINRAEAGKQLAQLLTHYATDAADILVLGLPRGGVPVAQQVAKSLNAPLDVFVVRKLGVPGHEELALGAIATGGILVLNDDVVDAMSLTPSTLERIKAREEQELARREATYRHGRPAPKIDGRTIIIVDDGIATGATMAAAVQALKVQNPERIVVAAPVASQDAYTALSKIADDVTCIYMPEPFFGVGLWYDDFEQTSDAEVNAALAEYVNQARASSRQPETRV